MLGKIPLFLAVQGHVTIRGGGLVIGGRYSVTCDGGLTKISQVDAKTTAASTSTAQASQQLAASQAGGNQTLASVDDGRLLEVGEGQVVAQRIKTSGLSLQSSSDWLLYSLDTFEGGSAWSLKSLSTCGSMDVFLGGACLLGSSDMVSRTFEDLPAHSAAKVTGRLHLFDSWEGESWSLAADDVVRFTTSHRWCTGYQSTCKTQSLNVCGNEQGDKLSQRFSMTWPHSNTALTLTATTTLGTKDRCDASWGLDDIALYLKPV
ncbi:hypothetical protein GNI_126540 [Gregarina niphandrodes]|uniref:Uncharacterized protein n=1 Tax=Gregarina niphandrodes TaxID=110365 RepID=A0A023B2F5_GRENI|nr:hypothetical protein GNI_126540 [Gregarina niphandrodes]EZG50025.1 hypothetical protein GNI_126540 [Gregarina niphandrodes]|eukprot:XP_011132029.1 hypothetical protein GNI_126540 [Gregarina niphandrodes]